MKVVLDSSVLIAAFISRAGVCAALLEDVLTQHEWIISDFIVEEVCRKLRAKFQFPQREVAELSRFLRSAATTVTPAEMGPNVCRDTDDLPVLGTAVAASAALLVSMDKDLLSLNSYMDIAIIRPGEFWKHTPS